MRIRKSNVSSLTLPAGTHTLPVDQSRTVLQTYPQVQMQYGQAGAMVPRQTKYAVSTGVVLLQSDVPFTLVSNESTLRKVEVSEQSWVAQLNGGKYWQLSEPIPLDVGDRLEFYFTSSGGNLSSFVMDSTDRSAFIFNNSGMVQRSSQLGFLDINGVRVQNQVTPFPEEGVTNHATVDMNVSPATLEFFGCEYRQDRGYFHGFIYNIQVIRSGVVIHEIPLTNKAQGATQLATVGNVNATMVGYSEDVWIPN